MSNNCTPIVLVICMYHKKKYIQVMYVLRKWLVGRNNIINGGGKQFFIK